MVDQAKGCVQVFDLDGQYLRREGSEGEGEGQFICPKDVAIQGELMYVTDRKHTVQVFGVADGSFVRQWGSKGGGPGQSRAPWGLTLDGLGNLWICDYDNKRLQILQ